MWKTIADELREEGALKARREVLLRLILAKFGKLPADVIATVEASADTVQFDAWSEAILKARRLADVGIKPPG